MPTPRIQQFTVAGVCSVLWFSTIVSNIWARKTDLEQQLEQFPPLLGIAEKFNIDVFVTDLEFPVRTTTGLIDAKGSPAHRIEKYQSLFADEFNHYPKELVRNSKLKRVVLCENLSFAGQRRNAIPDFEHDTLYLDIERGDYNQLYQRKVIHHEFFHMIDYRDDGKVYLDATWSALNESTFRYGSGGRNAQSDASTSLLTDRYPGFLNHYSTTGVEEDKAEMFANMLVEPQHVERRAFKDPIVNSKCEAMKSLIKKFCPEVTDEFWKGNTK